jgi:hypothetical protein
LYPSAAASWVPAPGDPFGPQTAEWSDRVIAWIGIRITTDFIRTHGREFLTAGPT